MVFYIYKDTIYYQTMLYDIKEFMFNI